MNSTLIGSGIKKRQLLCPFNCSAADPKNLDNLKIRPETERIQVASPVGPVRAGVRCRSTRGRRVQAAPRSAQDN